jgi:hypothetical protein
MAFKQSKHLPTKDFCCSETADVGCQGAMAPTDVPFVEHPYMLSPSRCFIVMFDSKQYALAEQSTAICKRQNESQANLVVLDLCFPWGELCVPRGIEGFLCIDVMDGCTVN